MTETTDTKIRQSEYTLLSVPMSLFLVELWQMLLLTYLKKNHLNLKGGKNEKAMDSCCEFIVCARFLIVKVSTALLSNVLWVWLFLTCYVKSNTSWPIKGISDVKEPTNYMVETDFRYCIADVGNQKK